MKKTKCHVGELPLSPTHTEKKNQNMRRENICNSRDSREERKLRYREINGPGP